MSKKHPNNQPNMGYKPRPLGNTASGKLDLAIMANQMCLNELVKVISNDLTKEAVIRAIAIAIKEASEVQCELSNIKYLGK
jgi:D-ribose pyranose/furanose isomerase RbsD